MSQPSEDELRQAEARLGKYEAAAQEIATFMLEGARKGQLEQHVAYAAKKLTERGEQPLLSLVFDSLLTYILSLERRAVEAHGPLMTPEEMGFEEMTPETWQVGVQDQILAAAADQDFQQVARLAVDGQIRCAAQDVGRYDWDAILRSMLLVEQNNLVLVATEALHRLIAQEVSKEG